MNKTIGRGALCARHGISMPTLHRWILGGRIPREDARAGDNGARVWRLSTITRWERAGCPRVPI